MCSVVGYIGNEYCQSFILEGLRRLEYRGYDSAGFACIVPQDNTIAIIKVAGVLDRLREKINKNPINGMTGIGHTRWATHGLATDKNAHPHFDCMQQIAIVHNGIIENYRVLKQSLTSSHDFISQTDTEVVAHVYEEIKKQCASLQDALIQLVKKLDGAYACIILDREHPAVLVGIRKSSPLCVGVGETQMFIASDVCVFADKTNKVLFLPDESFAIVSQDTVHVYDFDGQKLDIPLQHVDISVEAYDKSGYEHFMLKEIYEQKDSIAATIAYLKSQYADLWQKLALSECAIQEITRVYLIGCGTSWYAAYVAKFFFEHIVHVPAELLLASEFRYSSFFPDQQGLYLFISQSGETADTLECLRMVSAQGLHTIAITNVVSSSMAREAGGFLLTQAGREVSVASTKSFSAQMALLYWFAYALSVRKGITTVQKLEQAQKDITHCAEILEQTIEHYKERIITEYAPRYAQYDTAIFLGRNSAYPLALEAALKIKELAYVFAHAYAAGELKHGPLALIDDTVPVYIFSHLDPVIYQKLLSNAQEVKARAGHVVVFAFEGQQDLVTLAEVAFVFPRTQPLLGVLAMTGVMQFLVYAIAKERGCPIDKPRNLAKSVTVE